MIGVNDWGFLPNPGSTGRRPVSTNIDDYGDGDQTQGVTEEKIPRSYVEMMDYIWRKYYA